MVDGKIQGDVADYAGRLGVPVSYFHDKNGMLHAYAQPEMKDAPVQVVRKEDQLYIDAYVKFTGDNADIQAAYDVILKAWNTNQSYHIGGEDELGNKLNNDTVTLHTTIHSTGGPQSMNQNLVPAGHNTVTINLDKDSEVKGLFKGSSHVLTEDPKEFLYPFAYNPIVDKEKYGESIIKGYKDVLPNVVDALKTGQTEKILYNWSVKEPGQMWLYDPNVAAHEFGHLLGLGDAYAAEYRQGYEAGETYQMKNEYGEMATYKVPHADNAQNKPGDIMRSEGSITVTDSNVALLANLIWREGKPYYYNKDVKK